MVPKSPQRVGAALVTGASRGIGRVIAVQLGALGYAVGVNYWSSPDDARQVVQTIARQDGRAVALRADVSSPEDAARLVERAEDELGPLTVLVNNAGITRDRLLLQMSETDWAATWCTDLAGARAAARRALQSMAARSAGRIVNLSSVVGATGNAGQANYAAAKSAVLGLTRGLAVEAAPFGVTVNCVVPGYITTDATAHLTGERRQAWMERIPMGRPAAPEDVAATVLFLLGPGADYVTGQCIAVDGGLLAAAALGR